MRKFLDLHPFHGLGEEKVKELRKAPVDEHGVRHNNIMHNKQATYVSVF